MASIAGDVCSIQWIAIALLLPLRACFLLSNVVPASATFGESRWNSRVTAAVIRSCSSFSGSSLSSRARELAIFRMTCAVIACSD